MKRRCYSAIFAASMILFAYFLINGAQADQQWPDSPYKGWADRQLVTPAATPRICPGLTGDSRWRCTCCAGSEIVKTKFRVATDRSDAWDWLNPITKKWEPVPDDIIHRGESTPTGEAVMFVYPLGSDNPRCFFPGKGGL